MKSTYTVQTAAGETFNVIGNTAKAAWSAHWESMQADGTPFFAELGGDDGRQMDVIHDNGIAILLAGVKYDPA